MPQDAIIQLMTSVLSQSQYTMIKHAEIKPGERAMSKSKKAATKAICQWRASVLGRDEEGAFTSRLHNGLANKKKYTVFVDGVAQRTHDAKDLLDLMSDHIGGNLVKMGKKYYLQSRGIPQGSVLSSLLCNYFYADLERRHLSFLFEPDCLLVRLIDDFLLITLDRHKAEKFVEMMHRGLPEYGVEVSTQKTLVNFDVHIDGKRVPKAMAGTGFPYCGIRINDTTLEITKDVEARKHIAKGAE
ncbi:hypothetical protein UVI_02055200 [Ustilaginoidea virens]|uniref:Telomerase reverse transcriptase n=1 Tax=Ustilaginoidea virens TaxID=1159556 RepID=A0A1B5KTV7_USTVR|nr:hypothetical protein UVI_02055200 [Ustilaginoidea virens]